MRRNLVFDLLASCSVHHRYFAGIANLGDVRFHAGLKAALARLGVRAIFFCAIEDGSNNIAARKRELVIATRVVM